MKRKLTLNSPLQRPLPKAEGLPMPVIVHATSVAVEVQLSDEITDADVHALIEAATALRSRSARPGVVLDLTRAIPVEVLWTQARRAEMLRVLGAVGCVAIVAHSAASMVAAKNAFDPLGAQVVWRVFDTLQEARTWVFALERLGHSVWAEKPAAPFQGSRVAKLVEVLESPAARAKAEAKAAKKGRSDRASG